MKKLLAALGFLLLGCTSQPTRTDVVVRNKMDRPLKVKIVGAWMQRTVEIGPRAMWCGWLDRAWIGSTVEVIIE